MPFVLLIFGEMLLISGIMGTQGDFFNLLKADFTGVGSFIYWLGAIAIIGAIGYVPKLKPISNAMLVLVLIVLILHQNPNSIFAGFNQALSKTTAPAPATVTPVPAVAEPQSGGSSQPSEQPASYISEALNIANNLAGAA